MATTPVLELLRCRCLPWCCEEEPYDPVTTRYVAQMFEALGVDRVVSMEVHNPAAFENAFRSGTDHLRPEPLLVRHFLPDAADAADAEITVASPDVGGIKRAECFGPRSKTS